MATGLAAETIGIHVIPVLRGRRLVDRAKAQGAGATGRATG